MFEVELSATELDLSALNQRFMGTDESIGAVVSFTGIVRGNGIQAIEVEHYPGMTESVLSKKIESAAKRWPLRKASIVHRIGSLPVSEPIVWVSVASAHRAAAFLACEFLMDFLKVDAPFWKKELDANGVWKWVEVRSQDQDRANRWMGRYAPTQA
ncbi:MAG: molybdenum cofactor biosynthesis protein MoaE [Pseudomonadota bacterium]